MAADVRRIIIPLALTGVQLYRSQEISTFPTELLGSSYSRHAATPNSRLPMNGTVTYRLIPPETMGSLPDTGVEWEQTRSWRAKLTLKPREYL